MLPTVEETRGYDFQDPENVEKWRGVFINPLRKVLDHEHPTLTAEESALQYVESLCLRLLAMLCAVPSPLTVQDVEERVARTFPTPLDKWAITEARDLVTIKRRKPMIPCDKLHQLLQKEVLLYKIDVSVSQFITAVLEFMSSDILRLAGNYVLMDMFYQESELTTSETSGGGSERRGRRGSLSYAELVRDLLTDEKHFLRDLNLIIRVFKDELEKILDKDSRLSERLDTAGHGFRLAVKYYLPKLLLAPVAHVFLYHNYVLALLQIAPASEDRESFKQVVNSGGSGGAGGGAQQLKLKEKLHIRKLELVDRPDTDEGRHMVELCPRVGPCVVLACASCAEKRNWMCDLVMLNTKPMLDRFLDSILLDLERRHPLKLPPASLYRFAVPDSPDNILLEDNSAARHHGNAVPLIKVNYPSITTLACIATRLVTGWGLDFNDLYV
ncbi:hypothetical protein HF086_017803 [Spodoptera exigua]|uniref:DH domain-containing protein n=1 Tax=Spodoptera exigua TaxID=7107 RepID=A0A922MHK4_SPOEX|nr:hypothetical protein HF086_017803 [Spodoptera exigua]